VINGHLALSVEEEAVICFLALQQRRRPLAEFAAMLTRDIGPQVGRLILVKVGP
jgi:hypothetical protein